MEEGGALYYCKCVVKKNAVELLTEGMKLKECTPLCFSFDKSLPFFLFLQLNVSTSLNRVDFFSVLNRNVILKRQTLGRIRELVSKSAKYSSLISIKLKCKIDD